MGAHTALIDTAVIDTGAIASSDPVLRPGKTARGLRWVVTLGQAWREHRLPSCRYLPSCSEYAVEALGAHGALRGSWLTTKRLCRCHPWGSHGYDPVPAPRLDYSPKESVA